MRISGMILAATLIAAGPNTSGTDRYLLSSVTARDT